jgi:hypothetical protein
MVVFYTVVCANNEWCPSDGMRDVTTATFLYTGAPKNLKTLFVRIFFENREQGAHGPEYYY